MIAAAFAFGALVLRDAQNVIFIVFGCFALLVMSDFGGLRIARARAYLTATLVGAILVALGPLASANAGLAAAVMLRFGGAVARLNRQAARRLSHAEHAVECMIQVSPYRAIEALRRISE